MQGINSRAADFPFVQLASLPVLPGLASGKEGDGASAIVLLSNRKIHAVFFPTRHPKELTLRG